MTGYPIRLMHLSDVHFGSEDVEALKAVETFAEHIRPEAILVSGDLTQRGRRREFAAARAWFDRLGVRAIIAPGNHDTPLLHMPARVTNPFRRYARGLAGMDAVGQLVELADGQVRVAAINTARGVQMRMNWADGVVDLDELDLALDRLKGGRTGAWRLLLCHHPLIEPGHSKIRVSTLRGEGALQRIAAAGVHAVLTGHIHDAFAHAVTTPGGVTVQMGAGTLSTRLRASQPSFCVVELHEDQIIQEVVHIEGGVCEIKRNYDSAARGGSTSAT